MRISRLAKNAHQMTITKRVIVVVVTVFVLFCPFSVAGAQPDFGFLQAYKEESSTWHDYSVVLRWMLFSISFTAAAAAGIQMMKQGKVNTILTIVFSLVAAGLNGITSWVFVADFRSYEKASTIYKVEMQKFETLFELSDLTNKAIADEFRRARLDLIDKLVGIKLKLIEQNLTSSIQIHPVAFAQGEESTYYITAEGTSASTASFEEAKSNALKKADEALMAAIKYEAEMVVSKTEFDDDGKRRLLRLLLDEQAGAEILSHAEFEVRDISMNENGYNYSVVKRLLRPVVDDYYFDLAAIKSSSAEIRIISVLANPVGHDMMNEQLVLRNVGLNKVSLAGWMVRDLAGKTWLLDALGIIGLGEERTISRNNQPMTLSNGGDTIELIDADGNLVQTVTYGRVKEGEIVFVAE